VWPDLGTPLGTAGGTVPGSRYMPKYIFWMMCACGDFA
jgi:hypothetical protein